MGFWHLTQTTRTRGNPGMGTTAAGPVATSVRPGPGAALQPFEDRLRQIPAEDWRNVVDRTKRASILIEWLAVDRKAALGFFSRTHYKDLWLPGVTAAIGEKATPMELLDIANGADDPFDAVYQVARWGSAAAVNGLADLMPSVSVSAAGPTAVAIGSLLADINIDRAMAFAMDQATDALRSSAIAGVMDELGSKPNGDAAVRAWYSSLPASLQSSDKVLGAYGDSIWASDPVTALQTLQGIGDPRTKMIACLVLARSTESSSPETAIAAVYESGLTGVGIYNHVNAILQNWSAVNPQAAASFLATTQIIPASDMPQYAPILSASSSPKG